MEAGTGETAVFDRDSRVGLVDAVAASSAVPGIWPPVTIGARRYVDGGVRSADNADLAVGWSEIVIVSPLGFDSPLPLLPLREVVATLRESGSAVTVLTPDAAAAAAIGANPLDPSTRTPAARRPRPGPGGPGRELGRAGLGRGVVARGHVLEDERRQAGASTYSTRHRVQGVPVGLAGGAWLLVNVTVASQPPAPDGISLTRVIA